jgi:hypothetical protein
MAQSRIFISYRRGDTSAHAGRLADRLGNEFGEDRVFMDVDTIEPGADFVEYIEGAVGSCEVLIALIGDDWLECRDESGARRLDDPDDFVRLEVAAGLKRDIRVVPVLVERATMPRAAELPEPLRRLARRNALEISDLRWRHDVSRLVDAIYKVLEGKGTEQAIREAGDGEQPEGNTPAVVEAPVRREAPRENEAPSVYVPPPPPAGASWEAAGSSPAAPRPNTKATVALVLGIVSILLFWALGAGMLAAIPAIILGAQARGAATRAEVLGGRGIALGGIWTGVVGVLLAIGFWVAIAIDISNDP